MSYYNLPTSKQIADYHAGQLPLEKNQWIEQLMNKNPFVKSAVEEFPVGQHHEVKKVSERVSNRIRTEHFQHRGFWNRYGSWISLSSLLIIGGILAVLNLSPDNRYTQEGMLLITEQESERENVTEANNKDLKDHTAARVSTSTSIEKEHTVNAETTSIIKEEKTDQTVQMTDLKPVNLTQEEIDKETKEHTKLSGKLLKSVRSVNLISKDFDATYKRNLPEYPGGDRAFFDYFRTQLKPVELDFAESTFDTEVTLSITIDKKGIKTNYKVDGALHPIHENQLANCVAKLPRFKPGRSDVTYNLSIIFN